jgi:hypothetical protein
MADRRVQAPASARLRQSVGYSASLNARMTALDARP